MCNFIMMGILLVTAYNGIAKKGRRQDNSKSYTQSYSKHFRQARVRTARPASLLSFPLWSGWWTRHLAAARSTPCRKQRGLPTPIIE